MKRSRYIERRVYEKRDLQKRKETYEREKRPLKRSRYIERRVYVKIDLQKRKETHKRDVMTMVKHTRNNVG